MKAVFRCSSGLTLLALAWGCSNAPGTATAVGGGGSDTATGGTAAGGSSNPTGGAGSDSGTAGTSAGVTGTSGTAGAGGSSSTGGVGGTGGAAGGGTAGGGAGGTGTGTGCKGATVCYDFEGRATPAGWLVPNCPADPGEGNQGAGSLLVDRESARRRMCSLRMKDFSGDQPQHVVADLPAQLRPGVVGSRLGLQHRNADTNTARS